MIACLSIIDGKVYTGKCPNSHVTSEVLRQVKANKYYIIEEEDQLHIFKLIPKKSN